MTQALTIPETTSGLMPALTREQAIERYNELVAFVKKVMKPNIDFGVIPGTNKPTLLKPGAEKLCSLFGLDCQLDLADSLEDWERGFFMYRYRAVLRRGERIVAAAEGSCNSRESKYRWRWKVMDEKPDDATADDLKAKGLLKWRKVKDRWYACERVENDDIYSQVNTLQKMAEKRALVASTLIAANASEFFTQDIEDMALVDIEVEVIADGETPTHEDAPPAGHVPYPEERKPEGPSRGEIVGANAARRAGKGAKHWSKEDDADQKKMRDEIREALKVATKGAAMEQRRAWLQSLTAFKDFPGYISLDHVPPKQPGKKTGALEILHSKIKKGQLDAAAFADWLDRQNAKGMAAAQDAAAEAPQEEPPEPGSIEPDDGGLGWTGGEDGGDTIPY